MTISFSGLGKTAYHVLLVRVGACTHSRYQALFPHPREPGDEAIASVAQWPEIQPLVSRDQIVSADLP